MKYFENIADQLVKAKIPCCLKLTADAEIIVECGFNYPDSLVDKIIDAVGDADIDVCAEESGSKIISSKIIAGGPKRYLRTF